MKTEKKIKTKAKLICPLIAALAFAVNSAVCVSADYGPLREVRIDSGAERGAGFVSVNRTFTTDKGTYQLILTGLKEDNKEAVVKAIEENYDPDASDGIRLVDDAFPDCEKYLTSGHLPEESEITLEYDSKHCWAGSVSNMLWISGWADGLSDPDRERKFSSEDHIFEYFNDHFIDNGSEIYAGIDWFFMGEAYDVGPTVIAPVKDPENPNNGLKKEFVSTFAQRTYDLTEDAGSIEALMRLDLDSDEPAVIGASIGDTSDNTVSSSLHAITIAGAIIDPAAESLADRYKAVIIIDSDNDSCPEVLPEDPQNVPVQDREADKESRPNVFSVYNLTINKDVSGIPYWAMIGYYGTDPYSGRDTLAVIYKLTALDIPSDELISRCTETEGSRQIYKDIDLVPHIMVTTGQDTAPIDYAEYHEEDVLKTVFSQGENVNLVYFIQNRSNNLMDDEYTSGKDLSVKWKVTRNSDGSIVAQGIDTQAKDLYWHTDMGFLVTVGTSDETAEWEAGEYTVTATVNEDRAVPEAYYLNNRELGPVTFTVKEKAPAAPEEDTSAGSEEDSSSEAESSSTDTIDEEPGSQTEESGSADTSSEDTETQTKESTNPATGVNAVIIAAAAAAAVLMIVSKMKRQD
ncbi:MAG: hypothetical protein IKN66_11010 [Ruminococcus sp.]|nr:hypothetical protein [Ruminococcus sp.]